MANWKGTAVPNSGTVENVYFNTNLSVEEVKNICSQLTFVVEENVGNYSIFANVENIEDLAMITIQHINNSDIVISIATVELGANILFSSSQSVDGEDLGFVGWNTNLQSPITINKNNQSDAMGMGYGENDKLSSLFSITPFTQSEDKNILMHPKNEDGTANKDVNLYPRTKVGNLLASNGSKFTMPNVAYKQGGWQGEVVPNSGTVEKVYFNTNLSIEEVVSIIENLNFNMPGSGGSNNYVLLSNANYSYGIYINKDIEQDKVYYNIGLFTDLGCFWDNNTGWKTFDNPQNISSISLVSSLTDGTNYFQVGSENNKLSKLFSTTPFEESSGGLFETNEDGTPNTEKPIQTGISEERVNELIDLKITGWLGGES